ncbi:MAG: hypothetical protein IPK14_07565 [Blastocatellia bacterium]|nr:hypothetical protein [Blastocatellia bacterium]
MTATQNMLVLENRQNLNLAEIKAKKKFAVLAGLAIAIRLNVGVIAAFST